MGKKRIIIGEISRENPTLRVRGTHHKDGRITVEPVAEFTAQLNEDETTLVIEALFLFTEDHVSLQVADKITALIKRLDSEFDAHVRKTIGE